MTSRWVLCVWLLIFLCVAALSILAYWGAGTFRLASEHGQTRGVIVGNSPYGHSGMLYRFEVGGRTYTADRHFHGYPAPPGTPVTVFYVPADPRITSLDDPRTDLLELLASTGLLSAFLASAVVTLLVYAPRIAADSNARMAKLWQSPS